MIKDEFNCFVIATVPLKSALRFDQNHTQLPSAQLGVQCRDNLMQFYSLLFESMSHERVDQLPSNYNATIFI